MEIKKMKVVTHTNKRQYTCFLNNRTIFEFFKINLMIFC